MSNVPQGSEVARLLNQIRLEQESAIRGLHGFAETARHEIITQKMMNIGRHQERLVELIGDAAIPLIIEQIDTAVAAAAMPLIVDQSKLAPVVNSMSVQ
jgi:hypothetical protein